MLTAKRWFNGVMVVAMEDEEDAGLYCGLCQTKKNQTVRSYQIGVFRSLTVSSGWFHAAGGKSFSFCADA